MIQQRQRILAFNLFVTDLVLTAASFCLAYAVRSSFELPGYTVMPIGVYVWMLWLMLPLWAALLALFGVYSRGSLNLPEQIVQVSKAVGLAWLVLGAVLFFIDEDGATNRLVAVFALVINYLSLISYRQILFAFRQRHARGGRHVAVIGQGEPAHAFAETLRTRREWGLRPVGVFALDRAREVLERGEIDEMIFVVDRERLESCEDLFLSCEELGVTATVVLNLFPHSIARMELHELDGFPLLRFTRTPTDESLLLVRRIMDLVLGSLLIVVTLPLMLAAAVLIKLTSPGPVLFRQRRLGLHGRPFIMHKFRSMTHGSEEFRSQLGPINEMDGPVFKSSRDPRITPVGRWIRRFSIDELPQLYNVLRGEMSLVGPRPPLPDEVARYERWQRRRLSMKPGITCLWQISGRNHIGFDEWMRLDLSYIDNWSLLLDLKILLKTVPVVLLGRGAR
jgi:exopolysaccharide biosynthesis polyprenyl glycosylphosphotransferase